MITGAIVQQGGTVCLMNRFKTFRGSVKLNSDRVWNPVRVRWTAVKADFSDAGKQLLLLNLNGVEPLMFF